MRAEYVPCWAFSAQVRCPWRSETQRTKRRDGEWRSERVGLDGVVERVFEDILVAAIESTATAYLDEVAPFPMSDLTACDPNALDGYDVPPNIRATKQAHNRKRSTTGRQLVARARTFSWSMRCLARSLRGIGLPQVERAERPGGLRKRSLRDALERLPGRSARDSLRRRAQGVTCAEHY